MDLGIINVGSEVGARRIGPATRAGIVHHCRKAIIPRLISLSDQPEANRRLRHPEILAVDPRVLAHGGGQIVTDQFGRRLHMEVGKHVMVVDGYLTSGVDSDDH